MEKSNIIMEMNIKTDFNNVRESDASEEVPLSFFVSRKAVTRAGNVIRSYRKGNENEEEYNEALNTLKLYRENHTLAIQEFIPLLDLLQKYLNLLGYP